MSNPVSLMKLAGAFSLRPPAKQPGEIVRIYPYKRSLFVSVFLFCFLAAFCIPYFNIGVMSAGGDDSLFSLVFMLFGIFFLMGWSVGVLFIALLFLGTLLGRERVTLSPGRLVFRLEILGAGLSQAFDGDKIRDMRRVEPAAGSATSWRGPHLAFEYEGSPHELGADMDRRTAELLMRDLEEMVLGIKPPASSAQEDTRDSGRKARPERAQPERVSPPPTLGSASVLVLITANLLPLAGVIWFGWSVGEIMLLYWAESAVVGVFNIARMWVINAAATLVMAFVFIGHYGGFMVGHLLFIYGFMIQGGEGSVSLATVADDFIALLPAFVALFMSHGVSFVVNFMGRREYEHQSISGQMTAPYRRILVMHLTLIFGGFLAMALSNPLPALVLMIVLKVAADVRSHLGEHRLRDGAITT